VINEWKTWLQGLHSLEKIRLPSSCKPKDFGPVVKWDIHVFADACDIGYGVAIYVKLTNQSGVVVCNLIFGKSRVVPLEGESIPRSELVAAVMAAESGKSIRDKRRIWFHFHRLG
jgi:hypothetical protein